MSRSILILCTGNSCRSQIAEGYFKYFTQDKDIEVYSAGVETHGLNPKAIEVMAEDGIDISTHTSDHIDMYIDKKLDWVITVCDSAAERCPVIPVQTKVFHHSFPDPAKAQGNSEEVMNQFRSVRDQIKSYAEAFVVENI